MKKEKKKIKELEWHLFQEAMGYIRRPDGSYIISFLASPAEVLYHLKWTDGKTKEKN